MLGWFYRSPGRRTRGGMGAVDMLLTKGRLVIERPASSATDDDEELRR